jgi:hypothetical protein
MYVPQVQALEYGFIIVGIGKGLCSAIKLMAHLLDSADDIHERRYRVFSNTEALQKRLRK